jgi:hypothetical protein
MGRSRRSTPRCPGGLPAANTDWTTDPTVPVGDLKQVADAEVEQPTSGAGPEPRRVEVAGDDRRARLVTGVTPAAYQPSTVGLSGSCRASDVDT